MKWKKKDAFNQNIKKKTLNQKHRKRNERDMQWKGEKLEDTLNKVKKKWKGGGVSSHSHCPS